jgi:hypothetical protein
MAAASSSQVAEQPDALLLLVLLRLSNVVTNSSCWVHCYTLPLLVLCVCIVAAG